MKIRVATEDDFNEVVKLYNAKARFIRSVLEGGQ